MYNYYQDQLKKLTVSGSAAIKIHADQETKWLDVNHESAPVLIEWLKQFVKTRTIADLERTGELPTTY